MKKTRSTNMGNTTNNSRWFKITTSFAKSYRSVRFLFVIFEMQKNQEDSFHWNFWPSFLLNPQRISSSHYYYSIKQSQIERLFRVTKYWRKGHMLNKDMISCNRRVEAYSSCHSCSNPMPRDRFHFVQPLLCKGALSFYWAFNVERVDGPCNNLTNPKKLSFPSVCLIQSWRTAWTGTEGLSPSSWSFKINYTK